ncbi:hypothetical protein Tco_0162784 [Tanacetum coccineum]
MERGFLSLGRRDVKQKKSTSIVGSTMENTSANEATTSTCNVEHNFESNIEQANDVTMNKGVADSCTTRQRIWLSNPTSLAAKIRDIESQILKGKLVFMGDDEKPLKPKSVYEPLFIVGVMLDQCVAALSNDSFVKAIDGANLTGNTAVSYVNLLDGEPVAYPVVENYAQNTWSKYRLVRTMMNSKGLFFFMFSSKDGMDAMLKNDGLSAIATKLDTPLMLDAYITTMCTESWGRLSYVRAIIDLQADVELKDTFVVAILKIEDDGFILNII